MAEKLVRIKNKGALAFEATLYHNIVCSYRQICTCSALPPLQPKEPPRRAEASFTVLPGETSPELPAAVKLIPQVKQATAQHRIEVLDVDAQVEEVK